MAQRSEWIHPCQKCGACCASYRVEFYWREAEPQDHHPAVPANFWDELDPESRAMKGTNNKHHPKCIALKGRIGDFVKCEIYNNRPSPCHKFKASYENGTHQPRCDEARVKHGLKPLMKSDWSTPHPDPAVQLTQKPF